MKQGSPFRPHIFPTTGPFLLTYRCHVAAFVGLCDHSYLARCVKTGNYGGPQVQYTKLTKFSYTKQNSQYTKHNTKFSYTKQNSHTHKTKFLIHKTKFPIHKTKFQYTKQNTQYTKHKTKFTKHKTKFPYSYIIPTFQYIPYIRINFKYLYARNTRISTSHAVVGYYDPVSSEEELVYKNDEREWCGKFTVTRWGHVCSTEHSRFHRNCGLLLKTRGKTSSYSLGEGGVG